eukprot:6551991-Pyramimonas_sp.AAC.1
MLGGLDHAWCFALPGNNPLRATLVSGGFLSFSRGLHYQSVAVFVVEMVVAIVVVIVGAIVVVIVAAIPV